MRDIVALAILLIASFYAQVNTHKYATSSEGVEDSSIWALSRRSLKIDSAELAGSLSNENEDYDNLYPQKFSTRPDLVSNYDYETNNNPNPNNFAKRFMYASDVEDIEDYDFDGEEEEEQSDEKSYRHGDKHDKKKKKNKHGGGSDKDSSEEKKTLKKYVPPFWFGKNKQKPGWGVGHVEQVGWIIPKDASPGGWSIWPSGWTNPQGLDTGELKYVDGKGWVGTVGAPWRQAPPHMWGPGYVRHDDDDEGGGKKGKKGKKKHKNKHKKKKDKKKKKKKKKNADPCGGGGGKKGKKGKKGKGKGKKKGKGKGGGGEDGWGKDPCDKGPKPWFGWPSKIKFVPPPPRGSQVWLKSHTPHPPKTGWSDYHGWNWKNKLTGGWGVSDLVGVVHL